MHCSDRRWNLELKIAEKVEVSGFLEGVGCEKFYSHSFTVRLL